ncbi:HPr kinase/phosphorylase [Rhizobium sp. CECT 9324]|uniref:HPr kinase/phosphorylase n=1 Tax=Rhizobium sp. CECT 9324 TaxID=2845820 RepID=UPI001E413EDD|nr:HPr kinase/phosphorylase [Rhizobium sp. CECT 9324]CAH0338804.1 HPr kinase/phosphorylase [Rhizobium sp. CECT 9324]
MTDAFENIHATAITVGGTGLIFLGPSGAGKSSMAFDCLAEARLSGTSAALISDDRVIIWRKDDQIIGRGPESIRGLLELRHSGIVKIAWIEQAPLHYAVLPIRAAEADRLPPADEQLQVTSTIHLPVIRVPLSVRFPLSHIFALIQSV